MGEKYFNWNRSEPKDDAHDLYKEMQGMLDKDSRPIDYDAALELALEKRAAEDGMPANKQDLKKLSGQTNERGFVPSKPKEAAKYYESKRFNVLNRYRLRFPEAIDLYRHYNGKLLEIYADNQDLIKKENDPEVKVSLDQKFLDLYNDRLIEIFQSERLPRELEAGFSASSSDNFTKDFGYKFEITITGVNAEKTKYNYFLEDKNIGKNFIGKIIIKLKDKKVENMMLPVFDEKDITNTSKDLNVNYRAKSSEKIQALIGLTALLSPTESEKKLYKGNSVNGRNNDLEEEKPVIIGKEIISSTMPFKRRIIDEISETNLKAEELLSSLSSDERSLIENEEGGIYFNVHYINTAGNSEGNWSETFNANLIDAGLVGICANNERALLEEFVGQALETGNRAIISIKGVRIPKELKNEPPGPMHRIHIRRIPNRIILVVNQEIYREENENVKTAKRFFNKRESGRQLNGDEQAFLDDFLKRYQVKDPWKVSWHLVDNKLINPGERKKYKIVPKKLEAA